LGHDSHSIHICSYEDVCNEQADKYFQTVIIDPKDEKGLDILKTANTSDFSDHDMDEEKEFMDEGYSDMDIVYRCNELFDHQFFQTDS
jgi:hypothetical protein